MTITGDPIVSFKPNFIYCYYILNVIFYSIDYLCEVSFSFLYFSFHYFFVGLKRQTSIHLLNEVLVQPLRMLVQLEPHSHTEYVHFEPSPVMISLGRIKDFHVVRARNLLCFLIPCSSTNSILVLL
ncbi:hypothetical protein BH23THE1_BH23THE1_30080 [soil metagenome]